MTKTDTRTSDLGQEERPLREDELASVTGGCLKSTLSEVMRSLGGALNTAARGG